MKAQTDASNGAAALDVSVSLICAPITENSPLAVDWVGSSIPAPGEEVVFALKSSRYFFMVCSNNFLGCDFRGAEITLASLGRLGVCIM